MVAVPLRSSLVKPKSEEWRCRVMNPGPATHTANVYRRSQSIVSSLPDPIGRKGEIKTYCTWPYRNVKPVWLHHGWVYTFKASPRKCIRRWPFRRRQIDMLARIGLLATFRCQHVFFDTFFTTMYQGRPAVVNVLCCRVIHPRTVTLPFLYILVQAPSEYPLFSSPRVFRTVFYPAQCQFQA